MKLLAFETSSPVGSLALLHGDSLLERFIDTPREQTDLLLPFVDDVLSEAGLALGDLDAIVFGRGPGSFTGLRIAAAVTQGLSFASGVPVVGVSSLEALAQRAWRELGIDDALVCVDARMREVYAARYVVRGRRATLRGEERLCPPEALLVPGAVARAMDGDALDGRANEGGAAEDGAAEGGAAEGGAAEGGAVAGGANEGRAREGGAREGGVREGDASEAAGEAIAGGYSAVGDGFIAYGDVLAPLVERALRVVTHLVPSARDLLVAAAEEVSAGRFLEPEAALPVYLRDESAWRR